MSSGIYCAGCGRKFLKGQLRVRRGDRLYYHFAKCLPEDPPTLPLRLVK